MSQQLTQIPTVREREEGKLARTSITNEITRALWAIAPQLRSGIVDEPFVANWRAVLVGEPLVGAAKYECTVYADYLRPASATWIDDDYTNGITSEGYVIEDDNAIALNVGEIVSVAGSHLLPHGSVTIGFEAGYTEDGRRIFLVNLPAQGMHFSVKIEKTGGANGTKTTQATWVYTVRTLDWNGTDGGSVLGTNMTVTRPRPNGKMTFQTGSTNYGAAFFDGTTFKLWDAGEVPTTAGC